MRQDLKAAVERVHAALGEPGVWWTGVERLKIVRETRAAGACRLCGQRKLALAPHGIAGAHDTATDLAPAEIEAIHRIVSDPGRLSEAWYRRTTGDALSDEAYIELLSIVAITTALDTFDRARAAAECTLPVAKPGEPTRCRPTGAKPGLGWMAMLAPADVAPEDPPLYACAGRSGGNVHLALSLVPEAMMQFWDLFEAMYLPQHAKRDFAREYRAIDHAQIEMLAARVAVHNQCHY
jgi:hypothetical protein